MTAARVSGTCTVPGDKSISHRAAILAALAPGTSRIDGFSPAGDCASTLTAIRALGAGIDRAGGADLIEIVGPIDGRPREVGPVDCGRAGTAMRLLAGVAASFPFSVTLTGDPQLLRRPMGRVAEPLRSMGAGVTLAAGDHPPILITGGGLRGIDHRPEVASAQVKSAVLLAGLRAEGRTVVREPIATRDHTERMLAAMGASLGRSSDGVWVEPSALHPCDVRIPGDPSSAAFLWAAAAIAPGSDLVVRDVGLNPARVGFLRIIERMGASVEATPDPDRAGEPAGSVRIRHSPLRGTHVVSEEIPATIDELPLVGLVATQADGVTEVRGAGELRVKESDRISGLVAGLRALGADIQEETAGFVVRGPTRLHGGSVDALTDHRLAMTFAVAALIADGSVHVAGSAYTDDSFPGFGALLGELTPRIAPVTVHRVLLIGDPVGRSVSPAMQRAAFAAAGLHDWTYDAMRVPLDELGRAWARLCVAGGEGDAPPVAGLNVTIPLKEAVIPLMDEVLPEATTAGSVNTVSFDGSGRAIGDSTDGAGFLAALARVDTRPRRRAVVLGTGGAARAVVACLRSVGSEVLVLGRNAGAGGRLAADLGVGFERLPADPSALRDLLEGTDLLANATPIGSLGFSGDASPLPDGVTLDPGTTVFDLVYRPRRTTLLERAARAGCTVVEGIEMLIEQGARSFERWTGLAAPVDVMRAAAYRAMDGQAG